MKSSPPRSTEEPDGLGHFDVAEVPRGSYGTWVDGAGFFVNILGRRQGPASVATNLELARLRRQCRELEKTIEHERLARAEEVDRVARFAETFVGVLGHDLRNPLSAITTAASLLEVRAESDKISRPVRRIMVSADRMERMISQLLDFTCLRLGRGLGLSFADVDLGELCRSVISDLETADGGAVRFQCVGDVVGTWDRERVTQLVSNLVANAGQHGESGSPALVRLDGSDSAVVRMCVENRGTIAAADLPLLFEPLRARGPSGDGRHKASGLGLGLYIGREVARAHGGGVRVESNESEGTRFTVELRRRNP